MVRRIGFGDDKPRGIRRVGFGNKALTPVHSEADQHAVLTETSSAHDHVVRGSKPATVQKIRIIPFLFLVLLVFGWGVSAIVIFLTIIRAQTVDGFLYLWLAFTIVGWLVAFSALRRLLRKTRSARLGKQG